MIKKFTTLENQKNAITDILYSEDGLGKNSRTTFLSACGTGKTYTGYNIVEKLEAKTILLLFPSIALIDQTNKQYSLFNNLTNYNPLFICSDRDISEDQDELPIKDMDFSVTTDENEILKYLSSTIETKIIFSTYHSSKHIVSAYQKCGVIFDIAIYDEAHRVAQEGKSAFSATLLDKDILIKKRLFMTATAKHFSLDEKDIQKEVFSMDNEAYFGKVCHDYTFRQAIDDGVIVDYKIIVGITTIQDIDVTSKQSHIRAAKTTALKKAITSTRSKKTIGFTERIELSKQYAKDKAFINSEELTARHIDSAMSSKERKSIMKEFKSNKNELLFNANLLSEGVDVPSVDMVAFMENFQSQINATQRIGRVMRKDNNNSAKKAFIFIPIFIDTFSKKPFQDTINKSGEWKNLFSLLNYLREADESLAQVLKSSPHSNNTSLDDFIDFQFSKDIMIEMDVNIRDRIEMGVSSMILDRFSDAWELNYELLKIYINENKCLPKKREAFRGKNIGYFIQNQKGRNNRGLLGIDRKIKLESMGVDFDTGSKIAASDKKWKDVFLKVKEHVELHDTFYFDGGTKNVLNIFLNRAKKAYKKNLLKKERVEMLDSIGIDWSLDYSTLRWYGMFKLLEEYMRINTVLPPGDFQYKKENVGDWTRRQRRKIENNELSLDMALKVKPYIVFDREINLWNERYDLVKKYLKTNGKLPAYSVVMNRIKVGTWFASQKSKFYNNRILSLDQRKKLLSIGVPLTSSDEKKSWEVRFNEYLNFTKEYGETPTIKHGDKGKSLRSWAQKQKSNLISKNKLTQKQRKLLQDSGFFENERDDIWCENLKKISSILKENGKLTRTMRIWITTQRKNYKKGLMKEERIVACKENNILFKAKDSFEDNLILLKEYIGVNKLFPPFHTKYKNVDLRAWINNKLKIEPKGSNKVSQYKKLKKYVEKEELKIEKREFKKRLKKYLNYKKEHGEIPYKNNIPFLSHWLGKTRNLYKKGELEEWKVEMLDSVDFGINYIRSTS